MANPTPLQRRQTGYRLPAGEWFNAIIDRVNGLVSGTLTGNFSALNFTQNGVLKRTPQIVTAAGSNSQTNAAAITSSMVIVTVVSATTRAFRLPTAATGKVVQVHNGATTAVKPYPGTNDRIGTAATNALGTAIAGGKANIYVAQDATTWRVMTGA